MNEPSGFPATDTALRPQPARAFAETEGPTIFHLFGICTGSEAATVPVGDRFEVLTLSEKLVRSAIRALAYYKPHPVGAAIAIRGRWSLLLPPGSHQEVWPSEAEYQNSGALLVPPVGAQKGLLRWARSGNETGRAFTAPLLVSLALAAMSASQGDDCGLAMAPLLVPTPEFV